MLYFLILINKNKQIGIRCSCNILMKFYENIKLICIRPLYHFGRNEFRVVVWAYHMCK